MEIRSRSLGHLCQGIDDIVIVPDAHRNGSRSQYTQKSQLRKNQVQQERHKSEYQVRHQAHHNKMALAHILRCNHKQHTVFQIGVDIRLFPEAHSVDKLMGNQAGNCRQNSRPVYPKVFQYHIKTAAEQHNGIRHDHKRHRKQIQNQPQFFDVVNFLEFHRIGFVLSVRQTLLVAVKFAFPHDSHKIFSLPINCNSGTAPAQRCQTVPESSPCSTPDRTDLYWTNNRAVHAGQPVHPYTCCKDTAADWIPARRQTG